MIYKILLNFVYAFMACGLLYCQQQQEKVQMKDVTSSATIVQQGQDEQLSTTVEQLSSATVQEDTVATVTRKDEVAQDIPKVADLSETMYTPGQQAVVQQDQEETDTLQQQKLEVSEEEPEAQEEVAVAQEAEGVDVTLSKTLIDTVQEPVVTDPEEMPQVPEKTQQQALDIQPKQQEQAPERQESLIDTVDLEEGGNWVLKRKALEDTVEVIEKISKLVANIIEFGSKYTKQRDRIDVELDKLIYRLGFSLGDLNQELEDLLQQLQLARQQDGDLSGQERDVLYNAQQEKQEIDALRDSIQSLIGLEQNLNAVVSTVDSQVKTAHNYQNAAWRYFQEIKKVLSDEKAEDLYYRTESLFQSVSDIFEYLNNELMIYFNEQLNDMREYMQEIEQKVATLKDRGVDLQKKFETIEQQELDEKEQGQEKSAEKPQKASKGFLHHVFRIFWLPVTAIQGVWGYVSSFWTGAANQPT